MQIHVKQQHGKKYKCTRVCHIVTMTGSLDCRLDSSSRLWHQCSWKIINCVHSNVALLTWFLFLSRGLLQPANHLFLRSRHSANFQKHLIISTLISQLRHDLIFWYSFIAKIYERKENQVHFSDQRQAYDGICASHSPNSMQDKYIYQKRSA